ncbi:MAG: T9SS type A sorting domain-containing protein [Chitinophagales bacterium]
MRYLLLPAFCFCSILLYGQCFTGLQSSYCTNAEPDTLTPMITGGYFSGDGISADGVFFPSLAATGEQVVYYVNTNYYDVDTTGVFNPIPGTGTAFALIDDGFSDGFDIGFTFYFFGLAKNFVRIHSNGFISFNFMPAFFPPTAGFIPSPGLPDDLIAAGWADYDPTVGGTIEYFNTGTAPYRNLVINYIDVPEYGGGDGYLTTQIVLHETTNIIEIFTTASPDYGDNKSMGIENGDGTVGFIRPGRNKSHWAAFDDYCAFIPQICSDTTEILTAPIVEIAETESWICWPDYTIIHVIADGDLLWDIPADLEMTPGPGADEYTFYPPEWIPDHYEMIYASSMNANGCSATDSIYVHVSQCEPIQQVDPEQYHIYPNPAINFLHIESPSQLPEDMWVYDVQGRNIAKIRVHEQAEVDISEWPEGLILLVFRSDEQTLYAQFMHLSE